MKDKRARTRTIRYAVEHRRVDGIALERWFVKTTINIALVNSSRWPARARRFRPRDLVQPAGLYAFMAVGDQSGAPADLEFTPLVSEPDRLVVAAFIFGGLRFLIMLLQAAPNGRRRTTLGDELAAAQWVAGAQRAIDERRRSGDPAQITFRAYAERWLEAREEVGIRAAKKEESRLRLHVSPTLRPLQLDEITPQHVRDPVRRLQATDMAPRTLPTSTRREHGAHRDLLRVSSHGPGSDVSSQQPCTTRSQLRETR